MKRICEIEVTKRDAETGENEMSITATVKQSFKTGCLSFLIEEIEYELHISDIEELIAVMKAC
jgi:hypothetical protein